MPPFRATAVLVIAVTTLAGCSSHSTSHGQSPAGSTASPTASSASPVASRSAMPTQPADSPSGRIIQPLVCTRPSQELLARVAADVTSTQGGPLTAASMVRTAETPTGTWYVIAVERRRVSAHDGSPMPGRLVGIGLTNIPAYRQVPRLLPLGTSVTGSAPSLSWNHVSWTGDLLQHGKEASAKALSCIGH